MSVDIDWDVLTGGPDGADLAESIRSFVHTRFQQVTLPRFIRAVKVRGFEFGSVVPEIELKDICDPLPDFYDEDSDDEGRSERDEDHHGDQDLTPEEPVSRRHAHDVYARSRQHSTTSGATESRQSHAPSMAFSRTNSTQPGLSQHLLAKHLQNQTPLGTPGFPPFFAGGLQSPGIPGGTSNLNYFHLPLSSGLSGTATPLAAVAGARFGTGPGSDNGLRAGIASSLNGVLQQHGQRRRSNSSGSLTPPSSADPGSRPPSQHFHDHNIPNADSNEFEQRFGNNHDRPQTPPSPKRPDPDPQDLQVVAHVRYNGNLKLSLTAEILLDYPMPSFVAIPLQLNITGVDFDGVAILAYIKKRAHFCFLAPEDADALVGRGSDFSLDDDVDHDDAEASNARVNASNLSSPSRGSSQKTLGGLLEHIKVESQIGDSENGSVLKNVGKVERFVLDQVRRIFEDELVYPSFWTVLV